MRADSVSRSPRTRRKQMPGRSARDATFWGGSLPSQEVITSSWPPRMGSLSCGVLLAARMQMQGADTLVRNDVQAGLRQGLGRHTAGSTIASLSSIKGGRHGEAASSTSRG